MLHKRVLPFISIQRHQKTCLVTDTDYNACTVYTITMSYRLYSAMAHYVLFNSATRAMGHVRVDQRRIQRAHVDRIRKDSAAERAHARRRLGWAKDLPPLGSLRTDGWHSVSCAIYAAQLVYMPV